jgi:hypothetical protein
MTAQCNNVLHATAGGGIKMGACEAHPYASTMCSHIVIHWDSRTTNNQKETK